MSFWMFPSVIYCLSEVWVRNFSLWNGLVRVVLQHGAAMPLVPSPNSCSSWSLLHHCPEKRYRPQGKGSSHQELVLSYPLLLWLGAVHAGPEVKSCVSSCPSSSQNQGLCLEELRCFAQLSPLPLPIVLATGSGWMQHPVSLQPICSPASVCCCVPGAGALHTAALGSQLAPFILHPPPKCPALVAWELPFGGSAGQVGCFPSACILLPALSPWACW